MLVPVFIRDSSDGRRPLKDAIPNEINDVLCWTLEVKELGELFALILDLGIVAELSPFYIDNYVSLVVPGFISQPTIIPNSGTWTDPNKH